jgi:hypothetical protein
MIPLEVAKTLHPVPEHVVRDYADHMGPGDNAFRKLLEQCALFRHAQMKPVILANKDGSEWVVSSEETFMQRLH